MFLSVLSKNNSESRIKQSFVHLTQMFNTTINFLIIEFLKCEHENVKLKSNEMKLYDKPHHSNQLVKLYSSKL